MEYFIKIDSLLEIKILYTACRSKGIFFYNGCEINTDEQYLNDVRVLIIREDGQGTIYLDYYDGNLKDSDFLDLLNAAQGLQLIKSFHRQVQPDLYWQTV